VRIRTTTRPGASPHPPSLTTATDNSVRFDYRSAPLCPAKVPVTGLLPGSAAVLTSGGVQLSADLRSGQHWMVWWGQLRCWAPNPHAAGGARA
jgi:hypothetical protein